MTIDILILINWSQFNKSLHILLSLARDCRILKMTEFWYNYSLIILISTPGYCHPHGSSKQPSSDLDCFNSFDNFDTCWEKIEDFCLDEATGEFKDCHETEEEIHENAHDSITDDHVINQNYQYSNHCYAR